MPGRLAHLPGELIVARQQFAALAEQRDGVVRCQRELGERIPDEVGRDGEHDDTAELSLVPDRAAELYAALPGDPAHDGTADEEPVQVGAEVDLEVFAVAQVDFSLEVEIGVFELAVSTDDADLQQRVLGQALRDLLDLVLEPLFLVLPVIFRELLGREVYAVDQHRDDFGARAVDLGGTQLGLRQRLPPQLGSRDLEPPPVKAGDQQQSAQHQRDRPQQARPPAFEVSRSRQHRQ